MLITHQVNSGTGSLYGNRASSEMVRVTILPKMAVEVVQNMLENRPLRPDLFELLICVPVTALHGCLPFAQIIQQVFLDAVYAAEPV